MYFNICKPKEPNLFIYNIFCYNDNGHFSYYSDDGKTYMTFPNQITQLMFNIYEKYIIHYYIKNNNITKIYFKLKCGLQEKYKYKFNYDNDIYILNIDYSKLQNK